MAIQASTLFVLSDYLISKAGVHTGLYYADSTTLTVCHSKRIHNPQVFKNIAARSKSTIGWFFGFKLHLAINHEGELITFCLTKGSVDDRKALLPLIKVRSVND